MVSLTTILVGNSRALRLHANRLVLSDVQPCCCDPCRYVLCISVIDEDDSNFNRNQDWATFRAAWPDRKFFLLQPRNPFYDSLQLPAGWDGVGPIIVARDEGNAANASNWYDLCDLDTNLAIGGKVALFVDNSGSMTTGTVAASLSLFTSRLADRITIDGAPDPVTVANGRLILLQEGSERWIYPHISIEDCPPPT